MPDHGTSFWDFNIIEIVTVVGVGVTAALGIRGWWSRKQRNKRLISLDEKWEAFRDYNPNRPEFRVILRAAVYLPLHSIAYKFEVTDGDAPLPMRGDRPVQTMTRADLWVMTLTADLDAIPADLDAIRVRLKVILDGDTSKRSEWRTVPVEDINVPIAPTPQGE